MKTALLLFLPKFLKKQRDKWRIIIAFKKALKARNRAIDNIAMNRLENLSLDLNFGNDFFRETETIINQIDLDWAKGRQSTAMEIRERGKQLGISAKRIERIQRKFDAELDLTVKILNLETEIYSAFQAKKI